MLIWLHSKWSLENFTHTQRRNEFHWPGPIPRYQDCFDVDFYHLQQTQSQTLKSYQKITKLSIKSKSNQQEKCYFLIRKHLIIHSNNLPADDEDLARSSIDAHFGEYESPLWFEMSSSSSPSACKKSQHNSLITRCGFMSTIHDSKSNSLQFFHVVL